MFLRWILLSATVRHLPTLQLYAYNIIWSKTISEQNNTELGRPGNITVDKIRRKVESESKIDAKSSATWNGFLKVM